MRGDTPSAPAVSFTLSLKSAHTVSGYGWSVPFALKSCNFSREMKLFLGGLSKLFWKP